MLFAGKHLIFWYLWFKGGQSEYIRGNEGIIEHGGINQKFSTSKTTASPPSITPKALLARNTPLLNDSSGQECFSSWYWQLYSENDPKFWFPLTSRTIAANRTMVFETVQKFGPGSIYTECDGITRWKFTGNITSTSSSYFTVTASIRSDWAGGAFAAGFTKSSDPALFSAWNTLKEQRPTCSLPQNLCDRLRAASYGEIGSDLKNTSWPIKKPDQNLCKGIRQCVMVMKEVIIMYWPDNVQTRDICNGITKTLPWAPGRQSTVNINTISFKGQDLYLRTVNGIDMQLIEMDFDNPTFIDLEQIFNKQSGGFSKTYIQPTTVTGNWVLTSPTIYMAHRDVVGYVLGSETIISGSTVEFFSTTLRSADIIPISTADIFTMRRVTNQTRDRINYPKLVAEGKFQPDFDHPPWTNWSNMDQYVEMLPLDIGNMVNPVPASAYFDARWRDCWGIQTHCQTITDDSFRPALSLAPNFWKQFLPDGFYCSGPLVVDPPVILSPIVGVDEFGSTQTVRTLTSQYVTIGDMSSEPQNQDAGNIGQDPKAPEPGARPSATLALPTGSPRSGTDPLFAVNPGTDGQESGSGGNGRPGGGKGGTDGRGGAGRTDPRLPVNFGTGGQGSGPRGNGRPGGERGGSNQDWDGTPVPGSVNKPQDGRSGGQKPGNAWNANLGSPNGQNAFGGYGNSIVNQPNTVSQGGVRTSGDDTGDTDDTKDAQTGNGNDEENDSSLNGGKTSSKKGSASNHYILHTFWKLMLVLILTISI